MRLKREMRGTYLSNGVNEKEKNMSEGESLRESWRVESRE